MIGKAEGPLFRTDDEMIQELHVDQGAGQKEIPGQLPVGGRGVLAAGGMIVGNDHGRGVVGENGLDKLPRVDAVDGKRPFKEELGVDDAEGGIKKDGLKHLFLQVAHGMDEKVPHLAGRAQVVFAAQPLAQVAAGHILDEVDGEAVLRPHAVDGLQFKRGGLENRGQAAESFQQQAGGFLAVAPRRAQGEEQLQHLVVI